MRATFAAVTVALMTTGCSNTGPTPVTESLPPGVSIAYDLPERVSMYAPIPLRITVANGTPNSVHLALGTDGFGRSGVTVTRPNSIRVAVDPMRPPEGIADYAVWPGDWDLPAGERLSKEVVLNQWVDFSALGIYRVHMRFDGAVQGANYAPISVDRTPVQLMVQVIPPDAKALETLAADLFDEIIAYEAGAADAERFGNALKRLTYVDDPVAVPYWRRLVEEPWMGGEARRALNQLARHGKL